MKSKLVGLKPTHVWDMSQTAGDPVPELPRPEARAWTIKKGATPPRQPG